MNIAAVLSRGSMSAWQGGACRLRHSPPQDFCRYGNELDPEDTLALLVDHVRAGKANQAAILKSMPQGMQLPGVELRHMLDVCLYFIPAHRLKVCIWLLLGLLLGLPQPGLSPPANPKQRVEHSLRSLG